VQKPGSAATAGLLLDISSSAGFGIISVMEVKRTEANIQWEEKRTALRGNSG